MRHEKGLTMRIHLKEYRQLLVTYLAPQWPRATLLTVLLFGDIALQLVNPQLLRRFIDIISSSGPQGALPGIALLFVAVVIVQQGVKIWATYLSERVGWIATNALRIDLTRHLLRLDLSFHKVHTPGELIERVDGDITTLATFFSQFIIQVLGNLLLLLGVIAVLCYQDWRAGITLGSFTLIALVVINVVRNIAVPHWKNFRQSSAELYGFLEERITGTEDIRSSGAQTYMMHRLYTYTRARLRHARTSRLISTIPWSIPALAFAIETFIAFLLIAWLYRTGAMTLGMAFLIYFYTQLIFQPIMAITHQLEDFQKASAGMVRIRELLQIESKLDDGPGATFPEGALSVAFEHVSFGYGEEDMVVHDLSFRIEPGEVLGLLGRTGSGKTTITRLITRLYDPESGVILLGGTDLRAARRGDLRNAIGMVTQDVQLFHATVRDNLTFFDQRIPDDRIIQALNDLGLLTWYKALPEGLDTVLAANGGGLSAGEAQLLAFTRVFLRDPAIIILDEASSRLDPATEGLLEQAIDKLLRGRTAIIIAHRLRTVQRADTIMLLEDGRIREYGSHAQLANDPNSHFSQLLRTAHEEVLA
ncbi:MAG TPA: ABC transporter ATP-binding protein [Ktedonosporobacter sp.]|nr:ABC transporter ATP-binding protein [Ktedonosporobacter sp.]